MVINNEEAGCHETARFRPLHQQSITLRLSQQAAASYCGLTVKLIARMESCSLIRYRDRESIVETGDLRNCLCMQRAACSLGDPEPAFAKRVGLKSPLGGSKAG